MTLSISINRARVLASVSDPVAADLGARIVRWMDGEPAALSVELEGADAEIAARGLYSVDLLSGPEESALFSL